MEEWYKEVGELQAQVARQDAVGKWQSVVGMCIGRLIEPLKEHHRLYQLSHEVDKLEHWIAEKEVVAGSPELGQDFKHVTVRMGGWWTWSGVGWGGFGAVVEGDGEAGGGCRRGSGS